MCSCTIVSKVCPRCADSFEDIQQHCPVARTNGELCANRHLAEIPGSLCARCKERRGEQLARFGHKVGHAARTSVSSLKSHVLTGGRARAPEDKQYEMITVRYDQTRPAEPIIREAPPQERAKANRLTRWPSVLARRGAPATEPETPQIPVRSPQRESSQRQSWPLEGGGDSRLEISSSLGESSEHVSPDESSGRWSPLSPVLPDLELPPRTMSALGSTSDLSDTSSVYSQDSLQREPITPYDAM